MRQYKEAVCVKNSTGQGSNPEAILKLYPYFAEQDPILADMPTTKKLLTNEDTKDESFIDRLNDVRSGVEEDIAIDLLSSPSHRIAKHKSNVSIAAPSPESPTAAKANSKIKT